jgi:hypothetical protein
MRDRKISVPEIESQNEISKLEKQAVREFYNDSYYLAIHNKTNYYSDENYLSIYANGFNDNIYMFMVVKNSNVIQYTLNKPELDKKLFRFDIVYKMDGSIYTVVEIVKELENTLRDCFEDKNNLTFRLTGQSILSGIPRIAPKMEYKLNINKYGDVVFILENFNKHKNVFYRMLLGDGIEKMYKG